MKAALRLYEREEGRMPDRLSYIKNSCYQEKWVVLTTSVHFCHLKQKKNKKNPRLLLTASCPVFSQFAISLVFSLFLF